MATEKTTKPKAAAKTAEKPAEKTAPAKKAAAAPKAAPAPKAASTHGKVKLTQIGSAIGRRHDQEATLIGLGLNKLHRSRVLEDTSAVQGMIRKVRHLLKVEQA